MPFLSWKHSKAVLGIVVLGVFVVVLPARADISGTVSGILSAIAQVIISLVSQILVALIQILLAVTQYNDFINAPAVIKGWVLVRDVSNLAFLVIFIGIAFATILGVEKYEYKRLLPKLLIMAVLINFSRTICGLVLDAAQVLMMTFVNGFKDVAAGNLIRGFGLGDMLTLRDSKPNDPGVTPNTVAAASLLAVVMLIIATITVGVIVVMFLVRIIYLWILVLLSPLAFMLSAAPGLSGKFDEWWGKFIKYAFVGPIMAFFLWLSFSIMASVPSGETLASQSKLSTGSYDERVEATITKIGGSDQLLSYGIAIALLLLSLSIASEMGVKGGKLAESALGRIRSGGATLAKVAGVAALTGGVGTIGMYGAYKGGKAGIKGTWGIAKKLGLAEPIKERLDAKYGAKIVGVGGKILSKIGPTKAIRAIGKGYAEAPTRIKYVKKTYLEYKERKLKEETAVQNATLIDALNRNVRGRKTKRAYETELALAKEREKEISLDEAEQNRLAKLAREEMRSGKKGSDIDYIASRMALKGNNGDNTYLLDKETAPEVVARVIERLGELEQNKTITNAAGNTYNYSEAAEEYLELEHRENKRTAASNLASAEALQLGLQSGTEAFDGYVQTKTERFMDDLHKLDWQQDRAGLIQTWAQQYAGMNADQQKTEARKIGTRIYAQRYNAYEFDQNGDIAKDALGRYKYAQQILDNQNNFITHGAKKDDYGRLKDAGVYGGSADALHEQTEQIITGELLKKVNPQITDDMILELGRDLDDVNLKNNSFGLSLKVTIDEDGKPGRINLARKSGRLKHANLVAGKMGNASPSAVAGSHPLTTNVQSVAGGQTYSNPTEPEYAKGYRQATASNDARGSAGTRNDLVFALADSIHLVGKELPYTVDDQWGAVHKFNLRNHPDYGKDPLPTAAYDILFKKLLNKLGVKGIRSDSRADEYESLTKLTFTKQDLDNFPPPPPPTP